MKTSIKKTILASAVSLGMGLGVAGNAQADAYSIAYNQVTNLVITNSPDITFIGPSSVNSVASACLPNGNCVNNGGAGVTNAPFAQVGTTPYVENGYLTGQPARETQATSFSLGDASIDSQQTLGDPFTSARNMAEGLLVSTNTANANAGNSSGTLFTSSFVVGGAGGTVDFVFDANPFMKAQLTTPPGYIAPSQADATIAVSFAILNQDTGQTVFSWSPTGAGAGTTLGGIVTKDSFSLNSTLTALPGGPGPFSYLRGVANSATDCLVGTIGGCFAAQAQNLVSGNYTLNISMSERTNQQLTTVPEPAMLSVMGLGLAALGFSRRRKMA